MRHLRLLRGLQGQNGTKPRRRISAKGRARIAAAQKSALGKGQTESPKLGKTNNVSIGPAQDRGGSKGEMGEV